MDYEIYPLAITQVEWSVFIDVCQRHLGISPSRGIDGCHLDIKDPAAYLGSLDMENNPLEALRDLFNPAHHHFSISFIAVLDLEVCGQLLNTGLKVLWKNGNRKQIYVCILSGSMDQWYLAIINGCRERATYELRWVMNRVLAHLERAGFREIFSRYSKHTQPDGTFILKT